MPAFMEASAGDGRGEASGEGAKCDHGDKGGMDPGVLKAGDD